MAVRVSISGIRKSFGGNTAVSVDKLDVEPGEIVGLVGNNGAGKTTLFRLILDLVKADDGRITLLPTMRTDRQSKKDEDRLMSSYSINPAESEEWKSFTGAYIDDGFLIDFLTAEEFFCFVGRANGLSQDETELRLSTFSGFMRGEVLGQNKLIRNFSAGNKQKIGIVAAFLNRPQLIVLDEPFNFLDPTSQNALKRLLMDYNHETGATILVSSHNLNHTVDISTRIALLENGSVIRDLPNVNGSASEELAEYFGVN